ncbi:MAG: PAS domain S-box protein [Acidobacteriota bacterium]
MIPAPDDEELRLKSVALQNARSILLIRQRTEEELLRTQDALRESQERLKAALAAAGTGTFRWNIQRNTVEWDGNLDRLFGLGPGATTQSLEAFVAAVHAEDRPAVVARCGLCAREGVDFDMEFRVVGPDASVRWIHNKAKTFLDDQGRPLYVTGACADITSRKEAAEALRENEQRLQAMFNQAAVGIALAALDGRFLDMNGKFSEILGYSPAELRTRTFTEITHPDDLAETIAAVRRLLAGSIGEYSLEKRYRRADGSYVWSLSTVTLLKGAAGEPQRFIGVIEDISARKRTEAALQEETRALELLNNTGITLASQLDLRAVVHAVTDAARQLSGAQWAAFFFKSADDSDDRLLPYALSGATPAAFDAFTNRRAAALVGPTFRIEAPTRCDDLLIDVRGASMALQGHPPVRSYLAVPVRSRAADVIGGLFFGHSQPAVFTERVERLIVGVAAYAGVAIDNARLYEAAQKAAEERELLLESERAARTEAERMSDVKDEFLATLSHELRTPLNAILGWSQVLRSASRDGVDLMKGLEAIERNARVQTQLIEDLLDMSRITSGKLRLDVQSIQPVSFIEAAVETVKPAADAKGIRLEILLDPQAGPVSGDPSRLQQVVWNLLSNAIKFTPRDGKVQILLERVNSSIEVSVADTGIGIKADFIPHLFERFRQADASTTRKHTGLGLGLSIVKNLVELHGGTVWVRSGGEGRGTTVAVQLPLAVVHRQRDGRDRLHPKAPTVGTTILVAAELAGLKVLVVDDQLDARDLVRRILEDCEAEVFTAATATEALRLVEAHKPDVLVSDIGLPEVDGYELLKRVRALGPERGGKVPAIALTAFARSEDRTRTLRAGFLVHVSKPVDPSELIATVASVAGRVDDHPRSETPEKRRPH